MASNTEPVKRDYSTIAIIAGIIYGIAKSSDRTLVDFDTAVEEADTLMSKVEMLKMRDEAVQS
jgi:hypothetical protein